MKQKIRTFEETICSFPHHVKLKQVKIANYGRLSMREWLNKHNITVYTVYGDRADVIWDSKWSNFYFKDSNHATLFSLTWL